MKDLIEKIKRNRFQDFKGTQIKVNLPIPESILNDFIAATLQGESIQRMHLTLLPDNDMQVEVDAMVKMIFRTKVSRLISLRLEEALEVDDQFHTIAKIEDIKGGFGKAEETLIQLLSKKINRDLPPYVKLVGDEIKVNASQLLVDYGLEYAVEFVDQLNISTEVDSLNGLNRIWVAGEMNI
ncbi:MAG: hypothetical protein R2824_03005 [Saprospiraceae bacterium]|nr:hypothetical protein [Lewinella sp.]